MIIAMEKITKRDPASVTYSDRKYGSERLVKKIELQHKGQKGGLP